MHWLIYHVLLNFLFFAFHFDLIIIFSCFACAAVDTSIRDFTTCFFYLIELLLDFHNVDVTGIGTVFQIIIYIYIYIYMHHTFDFDLILWSLVMIYLDLLDKNSFGYCKTKREIIILRFTHVLQCVLFALLLFLNYKIFVIF